MMVQIYVYFVPKFAVTRVRYCHAVLFPVVQALVALFLATHISDYSVDLLWNMTPRYVVFKSNSGRYMHLEDPPPLSAYLTSRDLSGAHKVHFLGQNFVMTQCLNKKFWRRDLNWVKAADFESHPFKWDPL